MRDHEDTMGLNTISGRYPSQVLSSRSRNPAPVYLESDVLAYLAKQAEEKGVEVDQIANELLKREIARVK